VKIWTASRRAPCACLPAVLKVTIPTTGRPDSSSCFAASSKEDMGVRELPFSSEPVYRFRTTFMSSAQGYKRLLPAVKCACAQLRDPCREAVTDDQGNIVELLCSYDQRRWQRIPRSQGQRCESQLGAGGAERRV